MKILRLLLVACALSGMAFAGELASELNADQIKELKAGQQVLLTTDTPESPWPKVRAYRLIDATPEEVAAVFANYESAVKFIPNLKSASISKHQSPCILEVCYILDIPIISDEHYRTRNTLSANGKGSYRIDWKLIEATRTKSSIGHLRVEPYEGKALMCYSCLTVPGSKIAVFLKRPALDQIRDTVNALATEILKQKEKSPQSLAEEVLKMQAILSRQAQPTPSASPPAEPTTSR